MPARLILNADDFGLTPGINRAVEELHRAGVLTSATLMANGPAFTDAVSRAKALPRLGVGCHIVLVDGIPVSPPSQVPTLLGPDGHAFRVTSGSFIRDLFLRRIDPEDIFREARAQILKLQVAGIIVTHIDTHKHTHIFPRVAHAVLSAARQCGVFTIRYPFEPRWSMALSDHASALRVLQLRMLGRLETLFRRELDLEGRTTHGTLGIAATGTLDSATLHDILAAAAIDHADSIYELCCHPGYHDADLDRLPTRLRHHREIEQEALLGVIPQILSLPKPPQLIHYGNLLKSRDGET